jgi:hypothetical protein
MTDEDVEIAAKWEGDPGVLIDVLEEIGWLKRNTGNVLFIHDWKTHQPWSYFTEERSEKARRNIMKRWDNKKKNTKRIRRVYETNTDAHTPSPSPSPSPSPKDLKTLSSSDDDPKLNGFSPDDMARLWNEGVDFYAKDRKVLVPKILKLSSDRKKKALLRIKDCQVDESRWRSIINIVHQSQFLSGEKSSVGHEGWAASFDFVIKSQTTLLKILEGGYR